MESNRVNRKLYSWFWGILGFMPLVILLITFIGYLSAFKTTGEIYEYNTEETITGVFTEPISNSGQISKFYVNKSLSDTEIDNIVLNSGVISADTLNSNDPLSNPFINVYTYHVFLGNYEQANGGLYEQFYLDLIISVFHYHTFSEMVTNAYGLQPGYYYYIVLADDDNNVIDFYTNNFVISQLASQNFSISLSTGWYTPDSEELLNHTYDLIYQEFAKYYTFNNNLVDLFSMTPYEESTIVISTTTSLFDKVLVDTTNIFSKFQLPFLKSSFISLFDLLAFEKSIFYTFFVTQFVWMLQTMLLHVVVDTLAFLFKLYHKLMDKVV